MIIANKAPLRTASANQAPAPQPEPDASASREPSRPEPAPAPPADGYFSSGQWKQNPALQVGAWTAAGAAAVGLGKLAGPQVGLLGGGAIGAVTGALTCRSEKWLDKAASAVWGFAMNSAVGIIGDSSLYGGAFTAAINGVGSGIVFAKQA